MRSWISSKLSQVFPNSLLTNCGPLSVRITGIGSPGFIRSCSALYNVWTTCLASQTGPLYCPTTTRSNTSIILSIKKKRSCPIAYPYLISICQSWLDPVTTRFLANLRGWGRTRCFGFCRTPNSWHRRYDFFLLKIRWYLSRILWAKNL
ncbi:hypothetical protein D3C76_1416360 [compost metagenome]